MTILTMTALIATIWIFAIACYIRLRLMTQTADIRRK